MTDLPPTTRPQKRDLFDMMVLGGLERVTRALYDGHGFELEMIRPLANRCRALAAAFDRRAAEAEIMIEDE